MKLTTNFLRPRAGVGDRRLDRLRRARRRLTRRRRRPRAAAPAARRRLRRRACGRRRRAAAAKPAPPATPACAAAVAAVPETDKYAAVAGRPRRADELHAERRRHGLDADLGGARADDDDPGPRPLLRRHGAQEERRRHGDDQLRHHLPGDGASTRSSPTSLSFTGGTPFIGGFSRAFLQGILSDVNNGGIGNPNSLAPTIPETVYMCFQMTFAIITPALIAGAFAERMKFSAMLWFMGLWAIFVYAPVAHWLWGPDGIFNSSQRPTPWVKVLDFAGGTVVHINAGVAGLMRAIMLGKRRDTGPGHNMVLTFIGAAPAVGRLVRLQRGLRGQRGRAGRHGDDRHPDRDRGRGPDLDVRRVGAPRQADGHRHRLGRGRRPRRHHPGLRLRRPDRRDGDRRRLRRRLLPAARPASSTPSAMTTRSTASASTASAARSARS